MASKLNISFSSYQKIEQGIMVLSLERFLEICNILEIDSYNLLLPARNEDIVERVEKVLLGGSMAFENIRSNSNYCHRLIDLLKDKIEAGQSEKSELLEDLDFINNYLSIIGKDSFNYEYQFRTIRELIENID
ncbi:MAG: hypothetical protein L3J54_04285 [Draconibacterium sp.]|nr:hypothetical protein [Draconibacterium sp.]